MQMNICLKTFLHSPLWRLADKSFEICRASGRSEIGPRVHLVENTGHTVFFFRACCFEVSLPSSGNFEHQQQ